MAKNVRRFAALALAFGTLPTHLAIATSATPYPEVDDSETNLTSPEIPMESSPDSNPENPQGVDTAPDDLVPAIPGSEDSQTTESPQFLIKAISPGYSVDGVSNTSEFIELINSTEDTISLFGFSLIYNNGKTDYPIFEFPENSFLSPGSLVLRLDKSPEVKSAEDYTSVANLVYSKELALSGSLRLVYTPPEVETSTNSPDVTTSDISTDTLESAPPTIADKICWTGKTGCVSAFASKNPTVLVRHSSTGEFEHLAEYTPNFHLENYQVITPSEPEYEPDSDTNDDADSTTVDSDDNPTPASENPLSDTELNPNTPTDADTIVSSTLAPCPEGKYRNPETNRCKKIEEEPEQKTCAEGYYLNPSTNRCNKIKETTEPEQKICSNGYYLNPATNRCNKFPTEKELEPCKEGYERNPETNRCRKIATEDTEETELKPCAEGYERSPETNRCRKIKENTGADYPLIPTTGGVEQKNFVAIWGLIGIGALGAAYVIFQFRRDISHALKKFFARLFPKRRSK